MPSPDDEKLLQRARSLGYVSEEDARALRDALAAAERSGRSVRLAQLLLEKRLLSSAELVVALKGLAAQPTPTPTRTATDSGILNDLKASAAHTTLQPGERLGEFELVREIARGGMGVLFEGRRRGVAASASTLNSLRVAIKVLSARATTSSTLLQRFQQEATLASSIDHPNVIKIHEVGQDRGYHFIVMDYFEGRSLADLLRSGQLAPKKAVQVVAQIARAVQHVHDQRVLHRDLKPANILVGTGGRVVLTDFGLAKDFARSDAQLTQLGVAIGTPAYMAPEQASGELGGIGPWSDVYALGATLYRALSGHYPYDGDSFMATVKRIVREDPVPLRQHRPDCPEELAAMIARTMHRDPRLRPTAQQLADGLDRFLERNPILMPPPPANPKA